MKKLNSTVADPYPVSYTHLDVYKRQHLIPATPNLMRGLHTVMSGEPGNI